jgi:CBS domain-containing protein
MADKKVQALENKSGSTFIQHLLYDIKALGIMLEQGMVETGVCRFGAEQEVCFIDSSYRPAPLIMEFLEKINDEHYTSELAKFNMEINLDPAELEGKCFTNMEDELLLRINKAEEIIADKKNKIVLVGILPTIKQADLTIENMTPVARYKTLDDALKKLRGESFEFRITGIDEMIARTDSVMFESSNMSFQIHLQVDPGKFAPMYNWAQAISAPLIASATNSPMLLGKRLWWETRIALFQQSIDIRQTDSSLRDRLPRVSFGHEWVRDSVMEIFRDDIARHSVLIKSETEENSLEVLAKGEIPKLMALRTHNGSIYRWNRACYGIFDGKPHIRIENRVLPSGPSVVDETANSAFWLGMMCGIPEYYHNLSDLMDFDDAKDNFIRAARQGLGAQFKWVNNNVITAKSLILDELLPIARNGLEKLKIDEKDIFKYLGIIEERVMTGKTGSQWISDSFTQLKKESTKEEAIIALTAGIYNRQKENVPVHKWKPADIDEAGWVNRFRTVDSIMSMDLITVSEDNPIELVVNIMDWRKIRHVPVENKDGEFVGIMTAGILMHYFASSKIDPKSDTPIGDIMQKDVYSVPPESFTEDVLRHMRKNKLSCTAVVKNNKIVGLITEHDFLKITRRLFKELT